MYHEEVLRQLRAIQKTLTQPLEDYNRIDNPAPPPDPFYSFAAGLVCGLISREIAADQETRRSV